MGTLLNWVACPNFLASRLDFRDPIGSQSILAGGFGFDDSTLVIFQPEVATPYQCSGDLVDTFNETQGAGKFLWIEA